MHKLERQRLDLVARSHAQRQQLIAFGIAADNAVQRLEMVTLVTRSAAYFRRLWNNFRN